MSLDTYSDETAEFYSSPDIDLTDLPDEEIGDYYIDVMKFIKEGNDIFFAGFNNSEKRELAISELHSLISNLERLGTSKDAYVIAEDATSAFRQTLKNSVDTITALIIEDLDDNEISLYSDLNETLGKLLNRNPKIDLALLELDNVNVDLNKFSEQFHRLFGYKNQVEMFDKESRTPIGVTTRRLRNFLQMDKIMSNNHSLNSLSSLTDTKQIFKFQSAVCNLVHYFSYMAYSIDESLNS